MISWFARNTLAANFLMIGILLLGAYTALNKIPMEVRPSQEYRMIIIGMPYRGAAPDEVEERIIIPIERNLESLSGIKQVHSQAKSGSASITLFVEDNTDLRELYDEVQSRVNSINTFPSETERPSFRIPNTEARWEVISVAVTGDLPTNELKTLAQQIEDEITALPGISQTVIVGQKKTEVSIEARPEKLRDYNLSLSDLTTAVKRSSIDLSAGRMNVNGQRIQLSTKGEARSLEDYEKIIVKANNGSLVTLGEIANISDSYEEVRKITQLNKRNAIIIEVLRIGDESAIKIADEVNQYIETRNQNLPEGIKLFSWDDDSVSLRGRLNTLGGSLLQGAVLVLILLGLFLRPAIAFWVIIGIPVSFAGGLIFMPFFGISANLMSLFAFIIVIGIVVDDAIVTGENIYARISDGHKSIDATIIGTKEVATPVTFGILTTIVAFIPLSVAFDGFIAAYVKQIPPIVAGVLLFSLIESKLILPSHLKHIRVPKNPGPILRLQNKVAQGLEWFIQRLYRPSLQLALKHRYTVLAAFTAIALLSFGYWKSGRLGYVMMPSIDRYKITAHFRLSDDSKFEESKAMMGTILEAAELLGHEFTDGSAKDSPSLITKIVSHCGGSHFSSSHENETSGFVSIEILPPSLREKEGPKNQIIANRWRELIGEHSKLERLSIKAERGGSAYSDSNESIEVQLRGPHSETKIEFAKDLRKLLSRTEGIAGCWYDASKSQSSIEFSLKPRAYELGLTDASLARQIRAAFYGEEAQRVIRNGESVRVMVRLPESERNSLHTLNKLKIETPRGAYVPFENVASVTFSKKPSSISRIDGAQVLTLYAQAQNDRVNIIHISKDLTPIINERIAEHPELSWRYTGQIAEYEENKYRSRLAWIGLAFALYALLAIPFKSLLQPLFVLLAVPFGVIGAIFGHIILDITPSLMSTFGMLAMAGVVVNDSIVMVDYINRKRQQKADSATSQAQALFSAVLTAGQARFRPIFLTSLTTFVGLMPLIHDNSIQAQILIPMAAALAYGVLFATVITLFLIPCAYLVNEDLIQLSKKFFIWYKAPFFKKSNNSSSRVS